MFIVYRTFNTLRTRSSRHPAAFQELDELLTKHALQGEVRYGMAYLQSTLGVPLSYEIVLYHGDDEPFFFADEGTKRTYDGRSSSEVWNNFVLETVLALSKYQPSRVKHEVQKLEKLLTLKAHEEQALLQRS